MCAHLFMKKQTEQQMKPPIVHREILLEIEKTFRNIWDKERKTGDLFKKAVSLHGQVHSLLTQELCKPEPEQNKEAITALYERLADAEDAIDTVAELTKDLQELRKYFYGFMSEPREVEEK